MSFFGFYIFKKRKRGCNTPPPTHTKLSLCNFISFYLLPSCVFSTDYICWRMLKNPSNYCLVSSKSCSSPWRGRGFRSIAPEKEFCVTQQLAYLRDQEEIASMYLTSLEATQCGNIFSNFRKGQLSKSEADLEAYKSPVQSVLSCWKLAMLERHTTSSKFTSNWTTLGSVFISWQFVFILIRFQPTFQWTVRMQLTRVKERKLFTRTDSTIAK